MGTSADRMHSCTGSALGPGYYACAATSYSAGCCLCLVLQGMGDLMRENDDGVSVMQWLRSAYDQDWKNLLERLKPKLGGLDPRWAHSPAGPAPVVASSSKRTLFDACWRSQPLVH